MPVVHPEIKEHTFRDDGTFVYVAEVDIKPVFELKEYKGIEIEKPVTEVTDAEVDAKIDSCAVSTVCSEVRTMIMPSSGMMSPLSIFRVFITERP